MIHCGVFQAEQVRPVSQRLANALWVTLQPQLVAFGSVEANLDGFTDLTVTQACLEKLEGILFEALVLKGKMACAAEHYSFRWLRAGEEVDRATVDDKWYRAGPSEVLFCLSPVVHARDSQDAGLRLAARATVFSSAKRRPGAVA